MANRTALIVCSLAAVLSAESAEAGKARDYLNAPKDTWVTFYNYGWRSAIAAFNAGVGFDAAEIANDTRSQSIILTRIMDFGGRTGGISVILPWAEASLETDQYGLVESGQGDIGLAWEINLFGAPALSKEQFATWTPETFASFHLVGTVPTGDYDADAPLNIGSNRWTLTPTVNYSYTPDAGWTWIEAYASARIIGDDDDADVSQDPVYLLEAHVSRNINKRLWLSADAYWDWGGETTRNGIEQDDAVNTVRLGVGMGLRTWKGGQLMLNTERAVRENEGQSDTFGLRLSLAQVW
jgi:hypothetical protein